MVTTAGGTTTDLPYVFAPIELGGMQLRNRVMMTTHGPRLPQRRYLRYLEVRSEDVAVVGVHAGYGMGSFPPGPGRFDPAGDNEPGAVGVHPLTTDGRAWCERFVPVLREQAQAVQGRGARCVGQLHHAGASNRGDELQPVSAPSGLVDPSGRQAPHALTGLEIADLVQVYAEAAGRVQRAGLDAVEIHSAHGYLLQQFMSPLTNWRTDRYGGDFENRIRLLLEIIDAVRGAVADELPVGVRIPGSEQEPGGLSRQDMCDVAERLVQAGAAYLSVSNGTYTGLRRRSGIAYVAPGYVAPGPAVKDAAAIRRATSVPVIVTGRIVSAVQAERILADGDADLVGVTRALIADPRIFAKARAGAVARTAACIACNECHTGLPVRCTVNPAAGREDELAVRPAPTRLHIVVVGGGPAGMQCALVAAARGHHVTLLERGPGLGGALGVLGRDRNRPDLAGFARYLQDEVAAAGVDVLLDTVATAAGLAALAPDQIVLAVGADEQLPPVPGATLPHVSTGLAALGVTAEPAGRVAVVGGLDDHLAPIVIADTLVSRGCQVVLLTERAAEAETVEPATRFALLGRLRAGDVEVHRFTALTAIRPDALAVRDVLTGAEVELTGIDAVVVAGERRPRLGLAKQLADQSGTGAPVHLVGDCLAPRRLLHATIDATRLAVTL